MSAKTLVVTFTATFKAKVCVPDNATQSDIDDAVADIDIPENDQCEYVPDTFEPVEVTDAD